MKNQSQNGTCVPHGLNHGLEGNALAIGLERNTPKFNSASLSVLFFLFFFVSCKTFYHEQLLLLPLGGNLSKNYMVHFFQKVRNVPPKYA